MSKTCKKLLAAVLVAAMLVSTLVSGLAVSAATTVGTISAEDVEKTYGDTDNITATISIAFNEGVVIKAPHNYVSVVLEGYNLESISDPVVEYAADSAAGKVTVEASNLAEGKILLEAPVDIYAPTVKKITFDANFVDADDEDTAVGTYTIDVNNNDMTDVDEADIAVTDDDGVLTVVEVAHVCEAKELVNNEDGTHTVKCECGEDIETVKCVYENGKCACGAEEPVTCDHADATKIFKEKTADGFIYACTCECGEVWDEALEIGDDFTGTVETKKTINPTNDIAMTFRFASANISAYSDFIAVVTKEVFAKGVAESTTEEAILTTYDTATSGFYSFKFADVAAYEMNNKITCDLYGKSADNMMIKLGSVSNFSVAEYVTSVLTTYANNTSTTVVNLKKALVDLLIYGAKAQTLGKFNEANLVTNELSSDQLALGTPESEYCGASTVWSELPVAGGVLSGSNDSNKVTVTKTLNPAEKVYLQFTLKTYAADIDSYSVKFNYYDTKGNAQETGILSYADAGFTKVNNKGEVTGRGFQFDLAPVTTFDYPVTATIYCDGVAVYEEVYSIEAYVKGTYSYATNANASLANVGKFVQSLYAYGRSMATAAKVTPYIDFVK